MKVCEYSNFLQLSTEQKIIKYKKAFGSFSERKENKSYYRNLLQSLMADTYALSLEKKITEEEEASGFLIYLSDSFGKMVDDFDAENRKWNFYFEAFVKNRYSNYRKNTERLRLWEKYAVRTVYLTSFNTGSCVAEQSPRKEEKPLAVRKLLYVFHTTPVARENFFIYLLAYSANFSNIMIDNICYNFSIDKAQTLKLIKLVGYSIEREKFQAKRESLIYRSNYNLNQAIFAEIQLNKAKINKDIEEERSSILTIEKNLKRQKERLVQIAKLHPQANEIAVSRILSMNRGTVSSKIFYARQLLKWANKPDANYYPEFLLKKTVKCFKDESWSKQLKKMRYLPTFKPIEAFNLQNIQ